MVSLPLVALDESTCESFVTSGGVFVPPGRTEAVLTAIRHVKHNYAIDESAEIHCRLLFAGDKRKNSPFRNLKPDSLVPFLIDCATASTAAGCRWYSMYCDAAKYPKYLRFLDGGNFAVTSKHIAAILVKSCADGIGTIEDDKFELIFDRDSTKLDWGLLRRMQATHFVRVSESARQPREEELPLLQLADIAAYVQGREIVGRSRPGDRKLTRFASVARAARLHMFNFSWRPPETEVPPK